MVLAAAMYFAAFSVVYRGSGIADEHISRRRSCRSTKPNVFSHRIVSYDGKTAGFMRRTEGLWVGHHRSVPEKWTASIQTNPGQQSLIATT
jgi:hypothetical protein